jgi:iron complex outermembrane receptor protein
VTSWVGVVPTASDRNLSGVEVPGLPDDWNSMSRADFRDSDTSSLNLSIDTRLDDAWNMRVRFGYVHYRIEAAFSGNFGMTNGSFVQGRRFRRQTYVNTGHTVEAEAVGNYRFDLGSLGALGLRALVGAQLVATTFHRTAGQAPNDPALGDSPASPLPPWDLRDPSTWNRDNTIPLSTLTVSGFDELVLSTAPAVYGGLTVSLVDDRVLLLSGVRYTSSAARFLHNGVVTIADAVTDKLTPQYGVLVKPMPGLSVFASYAESFVPNVQPALVRDVQVGVATPTRGRGFDVGLKTDLLDGRLSGTLTFYEVKNDHILNSFNELDPATGTRRPAGAASTAA